MRPPTAPPEPWATPADEAMARAVEARAADWRVGPVVYHAMVDRFGPPRDLAARAHLYAHPRRLRAWSEAPRQGHFVETHGVWSHELDFWGGDLPSLIERLDHLVDLGADVLVLNPIHDALTNHKYDARDPAALSPEFGDRDDLAALIKALDGRGLRLMLDGVFNHIGRAAPIFQDALRDPQSPWRGWFDFDGRHPHGYACWMDAPNLPELRLDNPDVKDAMFAAPGSVVQTMLRLGTSGWRLDVAHDIGHHLLAELTAAARAARPDAWIVGELWNYPEGWTSAVDGVMNFHAREIILKLIQGPVDGPQASAMLDTMVRDAGIDGLLRSWLILDNHDTPRLATALPSPRDRRLARLLQLTLPGAPVIYYGSEIGMEGGDDPEMRAPMRWEDVNDHNPELADLKKLLKLRRSLRALRLGDMRRLDARALLAFQRRTDRFDETVTVLVNATDDDLEELVPLRDPRAMNGQWLLDHLSGDRLQIFAGTVHLTVPARSARLLTLIDPRDKGYTPYKRAR